VSLASIVQEIVALATNELLGLGIGELGCYATQGQKTLIWYFEVVMRWDVLRRTGSIGSSLMQEEVACVPDELFGKD
jgi:hypothetical protein